MFFTRREIIKLGLAAVPLWRLNSLAALAQPNSDFNGVQIGIIVSPYNYPTIPLSADLFLNTLVQVGINAVELQAIRMEAYAGAPMPPHQVHSGSGRDHVAPSVPAQERREARRKQADALTQWRLSSSSAILEKCKALRKLYHDAGVKIYAFRTVNMSMDMPDAEYDYFFKAAKALGANQITMELPRDPNLSKRMGEMAEQHKIMMGYHNHTQVNAHSWDVALAQSKYNGINLDVGHFTAAISGSPIPFIKEHHDRITCLHLKDRKYGSEGGQNLPWGQGDTPLKEILQLMETAHYRFPAGIELEYKIPAGSTPQAEIVKCRQFCRGALA